MRSRATSLPVITPIEPVMRARVGDDRVGGHRHVVATRGGDGTHRGDDRLACLAQPNHLAPDGLRAGDRAAGAVDAQHDGGDVVVGARLAQRGGDGVTAGARGAQRRQLTPAAAADDRARPGSRRRWSACACGRAATARHRRRPPGRSATGTAAAARPGRRVRRDVAVAPASSAMRAYASSRKPMRSTSRPVTASSRSSGALSASASSVGGRRGAGTSATAASTCVVQALDEPAVGLAVGSV